MAKRVSTSPTGSARFARASIQASNDKFEQVENVLGADLMARLKGEHEREIECLWEEQLMLREELERIVELMQKEILPREKQMHEMVEKMHQAWEDATRNVTDRLAQGSELAGMSADQRRQIEQLHDPMTAMEKELDRIAGLLGHDVVKPDIRGWQQQGRQAGGAPPSRTQPGSPTAGRTQIGSPAAGRTQTTYAGSSAQTYQQPRYQPSSYQQAPTSPAWQQQPTRSASRGATGGYSASGPAGGYSSSTAPSGYSRTYNNNTTSSYGASAAKADPRMKPHTPNVEPASGSGSPYAARTGVGSPYGNSGGYPAGGGLRSTTPAGRPTSPSGKRF